VPCNHDHEIIAEPGFILLLPFHHGRIGTSCEKFVLILFPGADPHIPVGILGNLPLTKSHVVPPRPPCFEGTLIHTHTLTTITKIHQTLIGNIVLGARRIQTPQDPLVAWAQRIIVQCGHVQATAGTITRVGAFCGDRRIITIGSGVYHTQVVSRVSVP